MKRKTLIALAIITACSTGIFVSDMSLAQAAETPATASAAKTSKTAENQFIKTSENAALTMRNVRQARLAIYDGQPERASTYVDAAITRVDATVKEADQYAVKTDKDENTKDKIKNVDEFVPYDATLTLGEDFVPTKEKMKHIRSANKHLQHGDNKKALETLKLGGIDVAVSARLMPAKHSQMLIEDAGKLLDQGKYYEANLDLKGVEDSVIIQTLNVDGTPRANQKS